MCKIAHENVIKKLLSETVYHWGCRETRVVEGQGCGKGCRGKHKKGKTWIKG